MIYYLSVRSTKQADQDIQDILTTFRSSIRAENTQYRMHALVQLAQSLDLKTNIEGSRCETIDDIRQITISLDAIVSGIRMFCTPFGHRILFKEEMSPRIDEIVLTVIRVLDGRAPHVFVCENILGE